MATQVVFDTLTNVTGGIPGTAPALFSGTTDQLLSVVTTAGAVADAVADGQFKVNDRIWINYDMDGTPGTGLFQVTSTSSGSLVVDQQFQPLDAALTSIAGLTTAADKMIYTTGSDVYTTTDLSSFARTILDDANAAAVRTTIGAQASASIIANTTAAYGGGGTSNAFTATGLTSASIVSAVIRASTNAVSICKALPGTNTLTVTFSADPGAATTVDYIAITAAQ